MAVRSPRVPHRAGLLGLAMVLLVASGVRASAAAQTSRNGIEMWLRKHLKHQEPAAAVKEPSSKHRATFKATRRATIKVPATNPALSSYLASEAALASLMYAARYERVGGDKFRCEIDPIRFFSIELVPMLDSRLGVDPHARKASLLSISRGVRRAKASEAAAASRKRGGVGFEHKGEVDHSSFEMTTQATTSWALTEEGTWALTTEQTLQVSMDKPSWIMVPSSVLNRAGNIILSQVLKTATPDYLHRLRSGYVAWAAEEASDSKQAQLFRIPQMPQPMAELLSRLKELPQQVKRV